MPPKSNPLKLNALQLRTLTLLQGLASLPDSAQRDAGGEITITRFPQAHGDHFHLGNAVVAAKDATGLYNEAVWNALARKGLARTDWLRYADYCGIRRPAAERVLRTLARSLDEALALVSRAPLSADARTAYSHLLRDRTVTLE